MLPPKLGCVVAPNGVGSMACNSVVFMIASRCVDPIEALKASDWRCLRFRLLASIAISRLIKSVRCCHDFATCLSNISLTVRGLISLPLRRTGSSHERALPVKSVRRRSSVSLFADHDSFESADIGRPPALNRYLTLPQSLAGSSMLDADDNDRERSRFLNSASST